MNRDEPQWYKDAVIYELNVRSFFDSVDDGVGDFRGLMKKLDYLEDLGVTAIWLLPFYPSPLKDDGYDISDYMTVNPQYGTLEDFKLFLDEAHRHGLRVITELVINHTSDQHPWFKRARRSPVNSPERNFYVWSDTPEKYPDATIMFPDFETSNWTWDPLAKQYFWHRFYSHQPDLNYDHPGVWDAIFPVVDFWFDLGVDGMRLDAVPYLYEREGTSCEHLPETHAFLKALRRHIEKKYPDRMLLAEANAWPEEAVTYFGNGDECHMAFHFPLMPRLFMALHQEDRFPIVDIINQTPPLPPTAQWCLFLRNHDELTLAMITDEERDYMYRAYAQDRQAKIFLGIRHRLAPLLKNDRRRIEVMNALLFSLPGTPVIYYGDEIGMGDNIYLGDRNGVRTPMQWSADRNAGFSRANPQKLHLPITIDPEYHYEAVNVEAQQSNPSSLLWWMKRLIALRKRFRAFGQGAISFLDHTNSKVLAFIRSFQEERILVIVNLSRFVQHVELDLHEYAGWAVEELFGGSQFPKIAKGLYPLSLGPHAFYWFSLRPQSISEPRPFASAGALPAFQISSDVLDWIKTYGRSEVEDLLPSYLQRREMVLPDRIVTLARILAVHRFQVSTEYYFLLRVRVGYRSGLPEMIPLLLTLIPAGQEDFLSADANAAGLLRVVGSTEGILGAALAVPKCVSTLLQAIQQGADFHFEDGALTTQWIAKPTAGAGDPGLSSSLVLQNEPNHLSVIIGKDYVLKLFRRIEEGVHPDIEMTTHLTDAQGFTRVAPIAGLIEWRPVQGETTTLAVLHHYVPNQGTAWQFFVDHLSRFFEERAATGKTTSPPMPDPVSLFESDLCSPASADLDEHLGGVLDAVRLLGERTAQLHQALGRSSPGQAFAPVQFNKTYQRSIYQSTRTLTGRIEERLEQSFHRLPQPVQPQVQRYLPLQSRLLDRFEDFLDPRVGGMRIRSHGDFHLRELLYTGNDFIIIDFEGQPHRTLSERRIKRSPLRDVAAMIRSFDYAAKSVLFGLTLPSSQSTGVIRDEDRPRLAHWAQAWVSRVCGVFVLSYLENMVASPLLPSRAGVGLMLELFVLEKALTEIEYDLTYRPDWLSIPLSYVLRLLEGPDSPAEPVRSRPQQ